MGPGSRVNGTGSLPANHVGPNTSHRGGYKMASAIQWFLREFNVNAFKDTRVMCPAVTVEAYTSYGRSPQDLSIS